MFINYFKVAFRNLQKQKTFTFINILGLSIGISCFSLILFFATNEFSFDHFHKKAANIYRPYTWDRLAGGQRPVGYTDVYGTTAASIGEAMKRDLPDVLDYAQLQLPWGENLIRIGKKVNRVSLSFADQSFFSIFDFPLVDGNAATALHHLNDIVLTESSARQIFGKEAALGKTVEIQIGTSFQPFFVSAVAKDIPTNSTLRFDVLGNYQFAQINKDNFIIGNNWHPTVRQTYVLLKPWSRLADEPVRLSRLIQNFYPNFVSDANDYVKYMKSSGVIWKENEPPVSFRLQPLLDIHMDRAFNGWGFTDYAKIDPVITWILLGIAAGILLIACINFTTLAIGRMASRGKEVGLRKVMGAGKRQISLQFICEALLLSVIATMLGLLLASWLLPWFNKLSGRDLQFSSSFYPRISLQLIAVVLIVGLLAGIYPAMMLSKFKPVEVLKNKIRVGGANLFTRSLVVFQFVLSIGLIVSTTIILQQTEYMINKNPGFNKENVVAVDASQTDPNIVFPLFRDALLQHPSIAGVSSAAAGLGAGNDFLGFSDQGLSADINIIDTAYIRVMGMQLLAGENLKATAFKDSIKPVIINETMMHAFGWDNRNAVGKEIKNFQGRTVVVAGVIQNFHYRPLSEGIKNQLFETSADKGYNHFYVRTSPGNPAPALSAIQKAWALAVPGTPIKYSFLDDDINNYYVSEQRLSSLVGWAGGICIFLASLGLLGLLTLAAINRTKEIGVRKVLGATVPSIIVLLSKDFLKLIFIAFLIASPLSWYIMNKWLMDYPDRIIFSWWVFVLAWTGTILIALVAISFQAIKAAIANPVKSLRTDG